MKARILLSAMVFVLGIATTGCSALDVLKAVSGYGGGGGGWQSDYYDDYMRSGVTSYPYVVDGWGTW